MSPNVTETDSDENNIESVDRYSLLDSSDESRFIPSESENDITMTFESHEGTDNDYESPRRSETKTESEESKEINVGFFVLVKFTTEKTNKFYIGQVIKNK